MSLPPVGLIQRRSSDSLAVDDELVAAVLRFISEHSHEPIRVGHVASEIARLRVERAKRKLVETKASIKSIAREFGFADSLQMVVVFNRLEGVSTSVYRRKHWRVGNGLTVKGLRSLHRVCPTCDIPGGGGFRPEAVNHL